MRYLKMLIVTAGVFALANRTSAQVNLQHTTWKRHSEKITLNFSSDTVTLNEVSGKNITTALFLQKHDTLMLFYVTDKKRTGVYKIVYHNSAQSLFLKDLSGSSPYWSRFIGGEFGYVPAQGSAVHNWLQLDATTDSIAGISLYKAYKLLKGRPSKPVIVAVIDNGFDIDHEDLKQVIWTNQKEIPGNGIDDDHNGYVDDIHGWNFRSDRNGKSVPNEQSAVTQMYVALHDKYEHSDTGRFNDFEKKQWHQYQKAKVQHEETLKKSKDSAELKYSYNINYNSDALIGGKGRYYGSPFITATPELSHGTHVAGIIAAKRNNGKGIDGIADNVVIMPIIATTGIGDERDKDVANAIFYAVDNGARIINMSFSKRFSPNKELVDSAIRYAERKHVLIIHAAGNEGNNIDTTDYYPIGRYNDGEKATNFITVGWSRPLFNYRLAHPYSNYGNNNVDLFAPGSDIYSTIPGNGYDYKSGSSMSTPIVTGVAALLMSYFPSLTIDKVKAILLNSVMKPDVMVNRPDSKVQVPFSSLSVSGGIVNAENAVKMALEMTRKTN